MAGRNNYTYIVGDSTGAETDPMTSEQLLPYIKSGQVTGSTFVKRSDQEHWGTAADFPELSLKDAAFSPHEVATGAASMTEDKIDPLAAEMEQAVYAKPIRNGGNWFFWIAAMSLINTIAATTGSEWGFALGLQLTYVLSLTSELWGAHGKWIALAGNLVLVGACVWFGIAGYSRKYVPYFLGVFIYAADTLLSLLSLHLLTIGIHIWALYSIFKGLMAFVESGERKWLPALLKGGAITAVVAGGSFMLFLAVGVKQALASKDSVVEGVFEPDLYVNNAEFEGYTPLTNGVSLLVKLPSGKIAAVTDTISLMSCKKDGHALLATDVDGAIKKWTINLDHDPETKLEVDGLLSTNITSGLNMGMGIVALSLKNPPSADSLEDVLELRTDPPVENEELYIITPKWTAEGYELEHRKGAFGPLQVKGFVSFQLTEWVENKLLEGAILLDKDGKLVGIMPRSNLNKPGKLPGAAAMSVDHLTSL